MASKSLNLLLNSALATMALGLVAFNTGVLDPYLAGKPGDLVAATDEIGTNTETTGDAQALDNAAVATDEDASGSDNAKTAVTDDNGGDNANATADVVAPRFDVVRVEPDGNVVIAGNAAAESSVEVITGATTLGQTTAGAGGDFAVVLSDPLEPGDYTIVLRSTSADDVVAMSSETAIVSIPESKSGEVLAIVDEPGKPSKLITVPESAEKDDELAADSGGETQIAAADQPEPGGQKAAAQDDSETVAGDGAASSAMETVEGVETDEATAGEPETSGDNAIDLAAADGATEPAAKDADVTDEAAAAVPEMSDDAKQEPSVALNVAVEAVEIEGDHVFVAGTANPGKIVRVYANKDLIGETQSSEVGRFLVESSRGLAVGEYIIRADMLEVGSAEVIARAAVPFEREAGVSVAAVAPKAGKETDDTTGDAAENSETADEAAGSSKDTESGDAIGEAAAAAEDNMSSGEQVSEQSGDAAVASESKDDQTTQVAQADRDQADENAAQAGDTMTDDENTPEQAGEAIDDAGSKVAIATEPAEEKVDAASASETEDAGDEVTSAKSGDIEFAKFDEDVALTTPKLEKTSGSVIIRRGDTLWRISRRVYGRGIRYTTIYTANRDQIENPHRIWPGQVFDVPGESDDGEKADLDAIADQRPKEIDEQTQ